MLLTLARKTPKSSGIHHHFGLCFEGRLSKELDESGASWTHLGEVRVRNPMTVWRARKKLSALMARGEFDSVVCHSAWTHGVFSPEVRRFGLPIAFWLHDFASSKNWVERWAKKNIPDLGICNSQFVRTSLPRIFPGIPSEIFYYPVGAPKSVSQTERAELRNQLKTAEDAIVIIQHCRLEEWKGHRVLLEALALIKDEPDWVFWQVGGAQREQESRYLAELKEMATRLGIGDRIRFLGQRSDTGLLLGSADIHCQPNTGAEPFGVALVEALYAGLPVVTTRLGGPAEIINESCGILTPVSDAGAVAAALKSLIEQPDLRAHLGRGGPPRAKELCDPATQLAVLKQILSLRVKKDSAELGLQA